MVEVGEGWWITFTLLDKPSPTFGALAPSIPIANRNRPQPASRRGIPVARKALANQYTTLLTRGDVSVHSASRARRETPRAAASWWRAASRPCPYWTPDGQTGSATVTVSPQGQDRYVLRGTDRFAGDERADDFEHVVTRRPPQPAK